MNDIDPTQVQDILQSTGYTPTTQANSDVTDMQSAWDAYDKANQPLGSMKDMTMESSQQPTAGDAEGIAKTPGALEDLIPAGGMILGGIAGTATGLPGGSVIGSGLGGSAGEAIKEAIKGEGIQPAKIATEGATGAAADFGLGVLGKGLELGKGLLKSGADVISKEGISGIPGAIKDAITSKIMGKSAEEVLATAPGDVSKLSLDEQKLWHQNQAKIASEQFKQSTLAAKQAGDAMTEQVDKKIADFNQQIGQTSRDEAMNLKKPAQQMMKDASNEYLRLTGEAADGSPALSKTMTHEDLINNINTRFEYNPELGASLKNDLGITETPEKVVIDPKTKLPVISTEAPAQKTLTNQEILDKARGIMQDVRKAARTGSSVYSAADNEAIQKYSFLMDQLDKNGVDMTEANKFWKEYAPVRNRIVTEVKPFDETGTQKMPMTSTLNRAAATPTTATGAASKLDAQNFISELETRMKLPKGTIGQDTRTAVEGMEKAKLSKETIAKVTKDATDQIAKDKVEALKTMSLQKYNDMRATRVKTIMNRVIGTALGFAGLETVRKVTGY